MLCYRISKRDCSFGILAPLFWSGRSCIINFCQNGGTCWEMGGTMNCDCAHGYKGLYCQGILFSTFSNN